MTPMTPCPTCGVANVAGSEFCTSCGAKIVPLADRILRGVGFVTPILGSIVGFGVGIMVGLIVFLLFMLNANRSTALIVLAAFNVPAVLLAVLAYLWRSLNPHARSFAIAFFISFVPGFSLLSLPIFL
jgi:zinc ribbon protein